MTRKIEDHAHVEALLAITQRALGPTANARLTGALAKAETLLEACFQRGESVSAVTQELMLLRGDYGAVELRGAGRGPGARSTPSQLDRLAARQRSARSAAAAHSHRRSVAPPTSRTATSSPIPRKPTMRSLAATTTATTTPTSLKDGLLRIGLQAIARMLEDFLARITKIRFSPVQMLEEIVRLEEIGRGRRRRTSTETGPRTSSARSPSTIIREGRTSPFIGSNGLGKTMIARHLANQAMLAGFSVLSSTAAKLIESLRLLAETLRRRLARYARPHLLICDEVGYLSYDSHPADLSTPSSPTTSACRAPRCRHRSDRRLAAAPNDRSLPLCVVWAVFVLAGVRSAIRGPIAADARAPAATFRYDNLCSFLDADRTPPIHCGAVPRAP